MSVFYPAQPGDVVNLGTVTYHPFGLANQYGDVFIVSPYGNLRISFTEHTQILFGFGYFSYNLIASCNGYTDPNCPGDLPQPPFPPVSVPAGSFTIPDYALGFQLAWSTGVSFGPVEVTTVPLPTALPLFATGLGVSGLLGWRRKRRQAAQLP